MPQRLITPEETLRDCPVLTEWTEASRAWAAEGEYGFTPYSLVTAEEFAGAASMKIEITAETSLAFDLTVDGVGYVLNMSGGEWRLSRIGDWQRHIGYGRIHWTSALARALAEIEKKP